VSFSEFENKTRKCPSREWKYKTRKCPNGSRNVKPGSTFAGMDNINPGSVLAGIEILVPEVRSRESRNLVNPEVSFPGIFRETVYFVKPGIAVCSGKGKFACFNT